MRAAVVVKLNVESTKIGLMFMVDLLNEIRFRNSLLTCADHDRRAVRIIATNVNTAISTQFLKPAPNIGLNVFHQVPEMNGTIGIG